MSERRETVALRRSVDATGIPGGEPLLLPEGLEVAVHQALGGTFTVLTPRGLARIGPDDADALGPDYAALAAAAQARPAPGGEFHVEQVWERLRTVYDPEIPADIVELGLVYGVEPEALPGGGRRVRVTMTLTAPGCGIGPVLVEDVRRQVLSVPGVDDAEVVLVFEPPWEPSRMSEAARLTLGFL